MVQKTAAGERSARTMLLTGRCLLRAIGLRARQRGCFIVPRAVSFEEIATMFLTPLLRGRKSTFGPPRAGHRRRRSRKTQLGYSRPTCRLAVESLEERVLLSVAPDIEWIRQFGQCGPGE